MLVLYIKRYGSGLTCCASRPGSGILEAMRRLAAALAMALGMAGQPPAELYKQAVELHQRGRLDEAVDLYRRVLEAHPESVVTRSNLGAALSALGRYQEAVNEYRTALARNPANAGVRLNLAIALYKSGEFEAAAAELAEVRRAEPDNRQALLLLADTYLRLGEHLKLIAMLEPFARFHSNDDAVSYLLGMALLRDGQLEKGQAVIDRLLRRGDSAEVQLLIGASQLSAGDYGAALKTLEKAAAAAPALPGLQTLVGMARMENDDTAGAKGAFRLALDLDPNDFEANLRLGAILRMENEHSAALPYIEKALRLRPASLAARYQKAALLAAMGRQEEALPLLEALVKESPSFTEAHLQLAQVYFRLGRREDGQRHRAIVLELQEKERQASRPKR